MLGAFFTTGALQIVTEAAGPQCACLTLSVPELKPSDLEQCLTIRTTPLRVCPSLLSVQRIHLP